MANQLGEVVSAKSVEQRVRLCWHIITSEYPPQLGGVSDYTHWLADGLAARGDEVHVWCPTFGGEGSDSNSAAVHREFGTFAPADLRRVGELLDRYPAPRRILVQWVPHGYGYKTMNVPFCWWLWKRSTRHGDHVELMVHEPDLPFRAGAWRQNAAALVHRFMIVLLLRAANRVWMSIPGWEPRLRPYAFGRRLPFQWLPIPSNVPNIVDFQGVNEVRQRYASPNRVLIGHFGTYGTAVAALLKPILLNLAKDSSQQCVLLMGHRSREFRQELVDGDPSLARFLEATGALPGPDVSRHLSACDLLIQPYPDGVSTRRSSFMAGLSHGKPIVTTRGPLSETLWTETAAVAIVPAGDIPGFVECVRRFRDDAEARDKAGQLARALYLEKFDFSHTVASLRRAADPSLSES